MGEEAQPPPRPTGNKSWAYIDGSDLLPPTRQNSSGLSVTTPLSRQTRVQPSKSRSGEDFLQNRKIPFAPQHGTAPGGTAQVAQSNQAQSNQAQLQWEEAWLPLAQQALLRRDELRPLLKHGLKLKLPLSPGNSPVAANYRSTPINGNVSADWVTNAGRTAGPFTSGWDTSGTLSAHCGDMDAQMEQLPEKMLAPLSSDQDASQDSQAAFLYDDLQISSAVDVDNIWSLCQPQVCRGRQDYPAWAGVDICARNDDGCSQLPKGLELACETSDFDGLEIPSRRRPPTFDQSHHTLQSYEATPFHTMPNLRSQGNERLPPSRPANPGLGSLPRPIPSRPQCISQSRARSEAEIADYDFTTTPI